MFTRKLPINVDVKELTRSRRFSSSSSSSVPDRSFNRGRWCPTLVIELVFIAPHTQRGGHRSPRPSWVAFRLGGPGIARVSPPRVARVLHTIRASQRNCCTNDSIYSQKTKACCECETEPRRSLSRRSFLSVAIRGLRSVTSLMPRDDTVELDL
jgi:hypothetical protein